MATLTGVSKQLGPVKTKTFGLAAEIWTQSKLAGHEAQTLFGYPGSGGPEHGSGLAIDFMVGYPGHHADGQWIRDYAWEHRVRHGLRWIIWEQHITTYNSAIRINTGIPRKMDDRGGFTANHLDHAHIFWEAGDYTPKPPIHPVRTLARGVGGADVEALQRGLNAVFDFEGVSLVPDGSFGAATEADVKEYQELRGLSADGKVGRMTRSSLTYTAGISL